MELLMILCGLAALIGLAAAPFLLPWRQHVRWLVATMALPDPVGLTFGPAPVTMCEVTIGEVGRALDLIAVEVHETYPTGAPQWYTLAGDTDAGVTLARLERWSAARATLLLVRGTDGQTSLHGPSHAVLGLRPWLPTEGVRREQAPAGDARRLDPPPTRRSVTP